MSQTLKCDKCKFENPSTHTFCGNCGERLTPNNNPTPSLISAPIEGERRQVTIIFADISGFTALNDAAKSPAEVEQVVRLINLCLQELSEAIYEFDGQIDKYIGDAIMAVFGAPKAHEDDPERALRAALAMQERLEKFNRNPPSPLPEPLGIHMGINTGTVIAGDIGADRNRSYTVMGDAVNVASRLEHVSERGEILISEATYNLTNRLFVFEEREAVAVKGKSEPLKIYQLKSAKDLSQTQRGLSGMEAPVIGREDDLKELLHFNQRLQEHRGGIVVLAGDAGLGKSRLVREFRKQVDALADDKTKPLWLLGRGLSYRQSFTNRLFVEILKTYLDLPENADESLTKLRLEAMGEEMFGPRKNEVIPYLATLLGIKPDEEVATSLPVDPEFLQQRTFLAMGEWVEVLVKKRSLIMVFEDLHWADPSSVKLIQYLLTLTVYNPVLMICVTRPERDSAFWDIKAQSSQHYTDNYKEVVLWPLTDEESRQVIKHLLKLEQIPKSLETLLLNRAAGNPLFLEELLRSLIEEGVIQPTEDGRWQITRAVTEIDIPTTLQGVLTARIDRLEDSVKRVLQVAAVVGRVFPRFVLTPIVGNAEIVEKALTQLEAADLIEVHSHGTQPEYRFKHVLTHETAYNSMLNQQRKIIHGQIGDHMSRLYWQLGEEYAAIVADHYYKSENWPRALRYFQRAAEAAIQSFANQQAVEFYNQALEVADKLGAAADQPALLAIYEGRAKILTRLGVPQQAIADYEAMLAKAKELNDDSAQMRALNGIGSLHASHYDFSQAAEFFKEALAVARRLGDEQGIADTLSQLGNFYYSLGKLELGVKCYQEALELSQKLGDESRQVEAEDGLAKIMLEQGEISASLDRYKQIVNTRRRLGYRSGLMNSLASLLMAQTFSADYRGAQETAEEVLELHRKSGDFYRVPFIKYYQAFGQLFHGEWDKAGENLKEGLRLAHEQRQKSLQALGMAWLGYYYLTVGLDEAGLQQAQESMRLAEELGSPLYVMRAQAILGTAYRHLDQLEAAVQELESVHKMAQSMDFVPDEVMTLYQLVRAYMDTHEWAKAEASLGRLSTLAQASDMKEFMARAQWLQSLLDIHHKRYGAALDALINASDLAEQIDSRLSQYIIQIQKSYVYHLSGNSPASRDAITYAQKIQKRLLETLPDESTRQAFLDNAHSKHLQEMVEANASSQVKVKSIVGDAVQ
ncbi:MAG: tetratricopeptide repeat protein [Anaerolineales bacterium]|nr:tetratricopeptide repeat protein [Anaerolineales bacterium]